MRELTFEVDDFGKPLLHNKMNSVIMEIYAILINPEHKGYANQAIGVGFIDYVGTIASDEKMAEVGDDLSKVINSLLTGIILSNVDVGIDRVSNTNKNMSVSISFSYLDGTTPVEGDATYQFTDNDGKISSHIFV